jgi:hypothetical protein
MRLSVEWEPRHLWVGVYWDVRHVRLGPTWTMSAWGDTGRDVIEQMVRDSGLQTDAETRLELHVWVCLVPCVPLHLVCTLVSTEAPPATHD